MLIQVELDAISIDEAFDPAVAAATGVLSLLSAVNSASIDRPRVVSAYDASPGITEREFVWIHVDDITPQATRRYSSDNLVEFLAKYDKFLQDANLKDDFKERVNRAISAYRRALADNDDALTDFLVLWSSMEAIDCVYHKVLPSRQGEFMDGVKKVFTQLQQEQLFNTLKPLRDQIAHGNLDLQQAMNLAATNIEIVRKALVLMVMRILKIDDTKRDAIVSQIGYKGKAPTSVKVSATIQLNAGSVKELRGHPVMKPTYHGINAEIGGDRISITPDWRFEPVNIPVISPIKAELRGDAGGHATVTDFAMVKIPKDDKTNA